MHVSWHWASDVWPDLSNERTRSLWVWVERCKCSYPILLDSLQPVLTKSTHPAEFAEDCTLGFVWPFWQMKGCVKPWNLSYLQQNLVVSVGCSPISLSWITEVVSEDGLSNFIMNLHPFQLQDNPSHHCPSVGHCMSSFQCLFDVGPVDTTFPFLAFTVRTPDTALWWTDYMSVICSE